MNSDMSDRPLLSILIASYNTCEVTLRCLRDLTVDLAGIDSEILLVDNASQDGTTEAVSSAYPSVVVVPNRENVGFGAANNQALGMARGRYLMMLNTDAFVHPGCCRELVNFLERHPEAGVVGARLLNADGSLQVSCYPFPTPLRSWIENLWISALFPTHPKLGDYRQWAHDEVREVGWVVGACFVCRREVVEQVGGFDPVFFMYSEETDWQQRLRRAGWKIFLNPNAVVTHLGGASGTKEPENVNRYFFTSLDHYQLKNHGTSGFLLNRLAMVVGAVLRLPAWGLVWVLKSGLRARSAAKMKHYRWLLFRQSMHPMPIETSEPRTGVPPVSARTQT